MNLTIDNTSCKEIIFTQGGVSHSLDKLYYNEHLVWEKQSEPVNPYATQYFTIESLEDNNSITLAANGTPPSITLYYSTDDGTTWSSHSSSSSKQWVLNTGAKLLFKATATQYSTNPLNYWSLIGTKTHNVYGNIMSLLYGDNFAGQTSFSSHGVFTYFFKDNTQLVDASNLVLPVTTFVANNYNCYSGMFYGCTSLTGAPSLPATTLANSCYYYMFHGCTSLTTAPTLPATTLANSCYESMFRRCTALTKAPSLPATTIVYNCYNAMFYGCSSLIEAPSLPATTLTESCYRFMFENCTSLIKAPILPAMTLATYCYYMMFVGCTSLNEVVCLATDISATDCLGWWLDQVAATGTFYKNSSMSSWTTGTSGIPSGWAVVDW